MVMLRKEFCVEEEEIGDKLKEIWGNVRRQCWIDATNGGRTIKTKDFSWHHWNRGLDSFKNTVLKEWL